MAEQESMVYDKESDMVLGDVISESDKYFDKDSPQYVLWEQNRRQLGLRQNHLWNGTLWLFDGV